MFVCPDCGHSQPIAGVCPNDQTALAPRGDDVLLGQQVGAYRISKLLGVGGMGRVYKGVHPSIGSRVAVKVLSRECADRPDLVERFFSEARAVNMIRHESIVNVLDLAQLPDGRPYIIMEYLDGAPLADIVGKRGPLPLGGLARLIAEVLDALAAAHAKGIVHRDLKPDNIYVTPAGRPKVLDFGIAKLRPEMGGSSTQTGSLLGTPHYMSPEQALGKPVDLRTDIYAMGVILFECACGRRPFVADSLFDLLRKHVDEPPPAPRQFRPDMPPALEQVIMFALAKDPQHRFQSCADLANALMQATQGLPPDQWSAITPSGSSRMAGQPSPSWGSQNTWPQSHPPGLTPPPSHPPTHPQSHPPTHPQSHPPSHVPTPPPPSFAAGQVAPPQQRKSNLPLILGLGALALIGGGVATAVVLTQGGGGSGNGGTAAGTGSATGSAIASASASGSDEVVGEGEDEGEDEDQDDIDEARIAALEAQVEALDDPAITNALEAAGGKPTASTDPIKKKLASFSSGVPQCDAYVRSFIELLDCPQMAQYRASYVQSAEALMNGFAGFKTMDANTRKQFAAQAGQGCQQGADAMKQAAAAMGCKISGGGGGATPPTPPPTPPPDPDVRRDGPYNLTIAGFNAKGWDYMKWLPTALAEAKKHFPDAQIARIDAEGVGPDGLVHFDVSSDWEVLYRFTSPSASKKPASHPAGVKWEPTCMVQIFVKPGDVTVIPMKGFGCEPPVPMPKCSAKQIWQKAVAKGAPASNAYAELWYGYAGGKWSFDIDDVFDDSFTDGC
jgi:serine/threonine protein kinase